ncbi:MAG: type I restriction-modification system subunit M N-terminal domain-containing protein [Acidobacteriaceae bacterium]|nr:type I restriction-modification system subunit M N-terminal domain-containing protein [Acidobacteriaceae bacterium]
MWDILGWLGGGLCETEILRDYPELSSEDIKAALQFAYQFKDKVTEGSYSSTRTSRAESMPKDSSALVNKLWNYCNILRDDGLSYGDYVEQLTFLLFLKMAHERTQPPYNQPSIVPEEYDWPSLVELDGIPLEHHYRRTVEILGKEPGMLRAIFQKAQNKIQDPAKLKRLIADLIDKESWSTLDADVKGDIYEGLLQKTRKT